MSTADATGHVPPSEQPHFFGHPLGLYVLFFTEMWERFSYYGMRGLLRAYMVYYLVSSFGSHKYPDENAAQVPQEVATNPHDVWFFDAFRWVQSHIFLYSTDSVSDFASGTYGTYTGLVYATPFIGGLIADRYIGQRRAVYIGGIIMALGHFVMASEQMFVIALLLLIVGNGFFKPNISTQVGDLYAQGDDRRDGAFTIFYMGINLGAFLSNLACGTLAAVWGWHYGFGAAGVGLTIGLVVYYFGSKYLAPEKPRTAAAKAEAAAAGPLTGDEWRRVVALVALCFLNVAFWAVYEQQGNTMQSWADTQTVWPKILGWQIPQNWFQSFNPFMIFMLAPLLDLFWQWQAKRGTEPSSVAKMSIGSTLLGLSFLVMAAGAWVIGDGKGSLLWPFFCTLILTLGELYLSPIGLSLVTKVSPARIVSMMMGIWLGSSFLGNILSGQIGTLYDDMTKTSFFLMLCAIGCGAGFAMFLFNKPLKGALGHH